MNKENKEFIVHYEISKSGQDFKASSKSFDTLKEALIFADNRLNSFGGFITVRSINYTLNKYNQREYIGEEKIIIDNFK